MEVVGKTLTDGSGSEVNQMGEVGDLGHVCIRDGVEMSGGRHLGGCGVLIKVGIWRETCLGVWGRQWLWAWSEGVGYAAGAQKSLGI